MSEALDFARFRPEWQGQASCRGKPPWWFSHDPFELDLAKRLCRTCPVAAPGLEYALGLGDDVNGVWAGTSAAERRRILA